MLSSHGNFESQSISHNINQEYREFTIFIPTFNRAHLLPRAFESIEIQTFRDFEVVIVDDGSTDTTEALVGSWKANVDFPVTYFKQLNSGRHVAHNAGVRLARGRFFVCLDSDDRLVPDALERFLKHWNEIPSERRHVFAGVEGLISSMDGQRVFTMKYPGSPFDASYLEVFYRLGIGGDKKNSILTDILRQYPYPEIAGERDLRDSLTWKRIAQKYIFRNVNEVFQQVEYQPDGLSSNRFKVRMASPKGFRLYYLEDVTVHRPWLKWSQYRRSMIDFIRFSLHSKVDFLSQGHQVGFTLFWLILVPAGILRWLIDIYRLRVKNGIHPNKVTSPQ